MDGEFVRDVLFIISGAGMGAVVGGLLIRAARRDDRELAKGELDKFGVIVTGWEPKPHTDESITDDMQYRRICQSLIQYLSDSHIELNKKAHLQHQLRREITLVDNGIEIPGGYFGCFERGADGKFTPPKNPWSEPEHWA